VQRRHEARRSEFNVGSGQYGTKGGKGTGMIADLSTVIAQHGVLATVAAVGLFIFLRGEFEFRYPRSGKKRRITD
jgi:hypothetical protein